MSKQIEEVMGLVEEQMEDANGGILSTAQYVKLDSIRSKLLEFLPVWKPIESAPKDGTEVLCWREDCGQFIAKHTSASSFPITQAEIDALDEETLFSQDWFTQWPQAIRLDGSETPTHWMPLQAPPIDEGAT